MAKKQKKPKPKKAVAKKWRWKSGKRSPRALSAF